MSIHDIGIDIDIEPEPGIESQLRLIVIGKDPESISTFDSTHMGTCEPIFVANILNQPLSQIANRFLHVTNHDAGYPVFGLVHADTYFGPGALATFTRCALDSTICGIVGREPTPEYSNCWCTTNPGPVMTLDSCSIFFRRDLGLEFDEQTFDGHHCHVEDLCLQACSLNIPVMVPRADATHNGIGHDWSSPWMQDYARYRKLLDYKWRSKFERIYTT